MRELFLRALVLLLSAYGVVSCGKKDESVTDPRRPDATEAGAPEVTVARREELEALVDAIVAQARELPRSEFDPGALAEKLGKDPDASFTWVRDNTWWAPYRGLLRGSNGVMLDRVGSSLDRAVLLGDLLRRSGHTVRLARARIPENLARELLGKVRPITDRRREPVARKPLAPETKRAIEAILPGGEKVRQQQIANSRKLAGEAAALVRRQTDQLQAALREVAPSTSVSDERAAVSAMRDHWWVELKRGGEWIVLDVLLPDARIGDVLVAASSTSEWQAAQDAPSIPEDDWHVVGLRVVAERFEGGSTTESTVLETNLKPAMVLNRPITLGHMPMQWPQGLPDANADPNALGNAAVNVKEWVPFLKIGNEYVAQSAFTDSGDVKSSPLSSQSDINEVGGGSVFGGFDDALSGGAGTTSQMTAEWIDFEVRVPGKATQRLRRPLFDLLGPANRAAHTEDFDATTNDNLLTRAEALMSSTDILLQPCGFTGEFVAYLASAWVVAMQADLRRLAKESDTAKKKEIAGEILDSADSWGPLPSLALWRTALGEASGGLFIGQANVVSYRFTPPIVNADVSPPRQLIDFASNATGIHGSANRSDFWIRVEQGIADTVAEAMTLDGDLRESESAASLLAMVETGPDRLHVFGRGARDDVRGLELPPDTVARMASTVESGYLVVAPAQPAQRGGMPRVAWWRVDPASGETIGVMDTGYHQALTEDQLNREAALRNSLVRYQIDNSSRMHALRSRVARGRPISDAARADLELYSLVEEMLNQLWWLRLL